MIKFAFTLASIALVTSSFISTTQDPKAAATSVDFIAVAKKAVPAVVSIKVQTTKKAAVLKQDPQSNDPYDFLGGNDLWSLFNLPKPESQKKETIIGQGSGVIIKANGHILTNSHVVHDMDSIVVLLEDGREFVGKVLGDDPNTDLALVKIEATDLPYLNLGDSDALEVGQWVAAVGNPLGLQATMTSGIVSAKSRNNLDIAHYEDFIQTDAAINRGNSGGPLLTLSGDIIGINTAIATTSSAGYMGIGFAVPSNMAKRVIDEILTDGKISHGFLGVTLQSIDYDLAQAFNLKSVSGALITSVVKDSPAEKAGLKVEDIVVQLDDKPINNSAMLRNGIYMMKPGTKINLKVMRKDQTVQIPITIGNFVEETPVATNGTPEKTTLGIEVGTLNPDVAKSLGYVGEYGVVITKVEPNSEAALVGLKKGALIMSVNRQKVETVQQFKEALSKTPKDRPALFQVKQGSQYAFISLPVN